MWLPQQSPGKHVTSPKQVKNFLKRRNAVGGTGEQPGQGVGARDKRKQVQRQPKRVLYLKPGGNGNGKPLGVWS